MAELLRMVPAMEDRTKGASRKLRRLIPPGYRPASYRQRLEGLANSGRIMPVQLKALEQTIFAIDAALKAAANGANQ